MKRLIFSILLVCCLPASIYAQENNEKYFNKYILQAVDQIYSRNAHQGYDSASYTHDISFGLNTLAATKPPFTMCVAAQVEIIAQAFSNYVVSTQGKPDFVNPFTFLEINQWRSLNPFTLRGKIWIVDGSSSKGTANALASFGMGLEIPFEELQPGAFINLNREKSGHAVVFIGYIDNNGQGILNYDVEQVAGFKYFSSQGKKDNGGFDYRYAFFQKSECPTISSDKKRDCGVIFSKNQKMLNTGQMLMPSLWSKTARDAAVKQYKAAKGLGEGQFDASYFDGQTTDD